MNIDLFLALKPLANVIAGTHREMHVTQDEYVKARLAARMKQETGKKRLRKKRLRKKKAQAALRFEHRLFGLARPLARRINYAEVARQVFSVEPFPFYKE